MTGVNSRHHAEIGLVGAGIIGLATGLRLLAHGWRVVIYTREPTPQTTSAVAAAFWLPYKVANGKRIQQWATKTRGHYREMEQRAVPGISSSPLIILSRDGDTDAEDNAWIEGVRATQADELPADFPCGLALTVPRIETPVHLEWLRAEFVRGGGRIVTREINRAADLLESHALAVNCAGVWARSVAPDKTVFPIRGQVVRVERPPGLADTILIHDSHDETTYVVPRDGDVILGGTAQSNEWETAPDAATAEAIVRRCIALRPELRGAKILEHRVGLRPARAEVRLEIELRADGRALIHHYGHGGAGFTLAWACAEEVVELAQRWAEARGLAQN